MDDKTIQFLEKRSEMILQIANGNYKDIQAKPQSFTKAAIIADMILGTIEIWDIQEKETKEDGLWISVYLRNSDAY